MRRTRHRRWNRLFSALTVLCLAASLGACSDDQGGGSGNNANNNGGQDAATDTHEDASGSDIGPDAGSDASDAQSDASDAETQTSSLELTIFDIDGEPIDSANVTLAKPGASSASPATGQTNADGAVSFDELTSGRTLAMVEADGFAPATAVVDLPANTEAARSIHLLATGAPHPFDPTTDSELYEDRVHVSIPANSLVDAAGDDYTGAAQALITPLNPSTHERAGMPGPLEGVLEGDDDPTPMQSVFMADVQLQTDAGEPLSLKDGAQATLEFVLPDDLQDDYSLGEEIEAYWYDTDAGMWRQEGMGEVIESTYAAEKLAWTVDVSHFTWWNCDEPWYDKECVQVSVVDEASGAPVSGAQIYVDGVSYNGTSYGITGDSGVTCVDFKLGSTAQVSAAGSDGRTQIGDAVEISGTGTAATCSGMGDGDCQQVQIELAPPSCLSGTVVDEGGNPIEGATISGRYDGPFGTESETATSGPSGEYCLAVPRGAEVDVVVTHTDANGEFMTASSSVTAADASLVCGDDSCTDVDPLTPEVGQMSCISGEVMTNPGTNDFGPVSPGTHVYVFHGQRGDAAGMGDFVIDCTKPPEEWGTLLAETTTNADGSFCAPTPVAAVDVSVVAGKCGSQAERCLRVRGGVSVAQAASCGDGDCTDLIEPIYMFNECGEGP
ncbi:carboxypeptidase-like regulatory domain-containing protein [Persicimonas caeni]|nr:carboxypeptidase-like regulatory domain-containing protein [Persicimonas caeni]